MQGQCQCQAQGQSQWQRQGRGQAGSGSGSVPRLLLAPARANLVWVDHHALGEDVPELGLGGGEDVAVHLADPRCLPLAHVGVAREDVVVGAWVGWFGFGLGLGLGAGSGVKGRVRMGVGMSWSAPPTPVPPLPSLPSTRQYFCGLRRICSQ